MNLSLIYGAGAAMLVVGIGFLVALVAQRRRIGSGGLFWVGAGLSTLLVASAVGLIWLTYGLDRQLEETPIELISNTDGGRMDEPAPDFRYQLVDGGGEHSLAEHEGEVVLLNFWATWCAPCLDEMPDLNRLQADYADEGLRVLTISDEPPADILAFQADGFAIEGTRGVIGDPTHLPKPFDRMVIARPATFVIDREGRLRHYVIGARTYEYFEAAIRPHL